MSKTDLAAIALEFARAEIPIFPCKQDKTPLTINGFYDASVDENQIREWFSRPKAVLIGMPTGQISGISVLDVDRKKHPGDLDGFDWLNNNRGLIPNTYIVESQNNGFHFYFGHCDGLKSNQGRIHPGVDIRADGGYIIVAGNGYELLNQVPLNSLPEFPSKILEKLSLDVSEEINGGHKSDFNLDDYSEPGKWHSTMLRFVAKVVCRPNTSKLLDELAPLFTLEGYTHDQTRAELKKMATSAKQKFAEPDLDFPTLIYPLPDADPLPNLPSTCVPLALRSWLLDVQERMDVPLGFLAIPTIILASSLIGRRAQVKPKEHDSWAEYANLWGMVVADPGALKSPAIAEAIFPIERLERNAREEWKKKESELLRKNKTLTEKAKALASKFKTLVKDNEETSEIETRLDEVQKQIEALEVQLKLGGERFYTNDATTEKLAEICAANPNGILVKRDELAGWFASLSKTGREGDREFYLEAWNGDGEHSYDRIGRGVVYVPHLCLSIFGSIQPGKLSEMVQRASNLSESADGLIQRFQLVLWPDQQRARVWVDRAADGAAREAYEQVFINLAELKWRHQFLSFNPAFNNRKDNLSGAFEFHFDSEAQVKAAEWLKDLEIRIQNEKNPSFRSHISKFRGLMPRLALVHLLVEASAGNLKNGELSEESLSFAIEWCEHLELHARKIWSSSLDSGLSAARALSLKIADGQVVTGSTLRDIQQAKWKGLETTELVAAGSKKLEEFGWLKLVTKYNTGGRPSNQILVNPELTARIGF